MLVTRRDILKAAAAIAASRGLLASAAQGLRETLSGKAKPPVIWLPGQGCNGDSIALLNSIHYMTFDELLLDAVDLKFHTTVMAAAGDPAVSAAQSAKAAGGYILVIEGAIPTGSGGRFCTVWPGMTMLAAVRAFAPGAKFILAAGTCAAFGGVVAGAPNPTGAQSVRDVLPGDARIINIPGCPAHPDWVVGTIAHLLANGTKPPLDDHGRPVEFFGKRIHDYCPERRGVPDPVTGRREVTALGQAGCLKSLGCRGPSAYADCYVRKFNSPAKGELGVNWCVGGRSPCIGCVQPDFPDGMSPFLRRGI